jgi:PAS domain-containing protein
VFLSAPLTVKWGNKNAIVYAVAVRDSDGRFLGAVDAVLSLVEFRKMMDSLDLGEGGIIAVRRSDNGKRIIRRPDSGDDVDIRSEPLWQGISAGKTQGTYEFNSKVDGIHRIYAFKVIDGFPLFVTVGLSRAYYLAPLFLQLELFGPPLAALLVLLALVFVRESRHKRAISKFSTELQSSDSRLKMAMAAGDMGVWEWDIVTGESICSDEWHRIFGAPESVTTL